MQIHIHAKFVIRWMKKERLSSTATQSVFAVRDPKENIHEQACIRTRHRGCSELEHCGLCSNSCPCGNAEDCSVGAASNACHETRQEAPSRSTLCLPERQEGRDQTRACYESNEDQSSILNVFSTRMAPQGGHFLS